MTPPDYEAWFRTYADAYNRSLAGKVDAETIRTFFAEDVLALGTNGTLNAAKNDRGFDKMLEGAYDFYKRIGTRHMAVARVKVDPLYENHDRVQVFYVADYEKKDGTKLSIPFDLVYLVQRRADGPRIFAFIAGDETGLYRKHGLVDEAGKPA